MNDELYTLIGLALCLAFVLASNYINKCRLRIFYWDYLRLYLLFAFI
jgi:hypothetical protein